MSERWSDEDAAAYQAWQQGLQATVAGHYTRFGCQPFPAGPVLPRILTDEPPLLDVGVGAAGRELMALIMRIEEGREGVGYGGTLLALTAALEWQVHHRAATLPSMGFLGRRQVNDMSLPLLQILRTGLQMLALLVQQASFKARGEEWMQDMDFGHVATRLAQAAQRRRQGGARVVDPLATGSTWACGCNCNELELGATPRLPARRSPAALAQRLQRVVDDNASTAQQPPAHGQVLASQFQAAAALLNGGHGGEWTLLTRLFLKLLHEHLGLNLVRPLPAALSAAVAGLLQPAARLVHGMSGWHPGRQGRSADLAATAAGLAVQLPHHAPMVLQAVLKEALQDTRMPACFRLGTVNRPESSAAQARVVLADSQPGNQWLGAMVDDIADIAREVASASPTPLPPRLRRFITPNCSTFASVQTNSVVQITAC